VRDREKDILERLLKVFKSMTYVDAKKAVEGDVDYNLLKLWIDENIPFEYEKPEEIAAAYNWFSRADVFEGRIRGSYWDYLKYLLDLMTTGVALAKKGCYYKFTKYQFPKYLRAMAQTVERRALLKSIGKKIGAKTHDSWRFALSYLPIMKEVSKKRKEEFADFYGFDEDEVAFVMNND
jgi:replication factor C large subunit